MKSTLCFSLVIYFIILQDKYSALLHFRTHPRVRVRATVKLSAALFHDESSITIRGGGYESAIAPNIL